MIHPIVASLEARTRDLDIKQYEIARALGVAPRTVRSWCAGHSTPSCALAGLWADYVGLKLAAVTPRGEVLATGPGIACRLRELRERAGLTQRQVAERRGVPAETVSSMERLAHESGLGTVEDHVVALHLRLVLLRPTARAADSSERAA